MTSVQHQVVTRSTTNHMDNHLDALLDDLQTSVSRPGTALASAQNGHGLLLNESSLDRQINLPPGATGYREVTTTVTRDTNGMPMTSREYQIEYLNPSNSITVLDDQSSTPGMELLKSGDLAGHQIHTYKTEIYDYKYSKTTSDKKTTGYTSNPVPALDDSRSQVIETKSYYHDKPVHQDSVSYSKTENSERTENVQGKTNVGRNLNELDMLLKELNSPPPNEATGEYRTTPRRDVHTIQTRIDQNSGRYSDSVSTMPKRSASATREVTYSESSQNRMNRAQSPTIQSGSSKSPARTINITREYNTMESSNHMSRRDAPSSRNRSEMSPTMRRRATTSPSGEFRPANFNNYPISPKDLTPTRTVTSKNYSSYSSTGRRTPTPTTFDEPQPYRSPSPVSFPQKRSPSPMRKSVNRSDSGRATSYQASENPAVVTYKYSSHSREQSRYPGGSYEEREESMSRPFTSSSPGEQNPPKKLDDLMASFEDSKVRSGGGYSHGGEYTHKIEYERESHDRQGGVQRSPSFERNIRPSNVKFNQSYSQQQQQEYGNQYKQREHFQQSHYQQNMSREHHQQQHSQPGSYHQEYRREEYHTRDQYPGQYQQSQQQYQQNQYQQHYQSQGGYQKESREQFQQSQQFQQNQGYQQQKPVNESMSSSQGFRSASASKSVAGPPVYYPPGVELFTKKEEAMLKQEQSGGKKKSKGKTKSKSESSEKGKGKGVSGVPLCLPVCCAMPCSIM